MNPAVELPASAVCRRTSLAGPCDDVASSVIVIVGANAGASSDLTLKITRDSTDGESVPLKVELVSVRLAASVTNSEGVATTGRLELGTLPCELILSPGGMSVELVCEVDNITIEGEVESKALLLKPTASEVVPAVGSAPGTPIGRPPVAI